MNHGSRPYTPKSCEDKVGSSHLWSTITDSRARLTGEYKVGFLRRARESKTPVSRDSRALRSRANIRVGVTGASNHRETRPISRARETIPVSRWGHAKEAPGADPDYKEGSTGRWGLMQWTPVANIGRAGPRLPATAHIVDGGVPMRHQLGSRLLSSDSLCATCFLNRPSMQQF